MRVNRREFWLSCSILNRQITKTGPQYRTNVDGLKSKTQAVTERCTLPGVCPPVRPKAQASMPSLFKYFTIVGAVLLGLLMLANSVLEPGGPKPTVAKATPKVIVKHDPRASLVERLRTEEAAQKAAIKGETLAPPGTFGEPVVPVMQRADSVTAAKAEPVQVSAPATVTSATSTEDAPARAVRLARKKIEAERVRKRRLARERARSLEQAALPQQNQLYYGYAPQPTYGPLAGWGQAQRW
jgi:hypothetical protein